MTEVEPTAAPTTPPAHDVSFTEALKVWARIAALSFGGPAGQIALMHRILVDEKRWVGERRFLHALNFCMLLPGPEAQQLAIYIGWLMHRTRGGVAAGVLFVLPGLVAIMALSIVYVLFGRLGPVAGVFFGLKCAVLAIVLQAVVRLGRRALKSMPLAAIAAVAFIAIFLFGAPFPALILMAGLVGFVGARLGLPAFLVGGAHDASAEGEVTDAQSKLGEGLPAHARPGIGRSLLTVAVFTVLWLAPTLVLGLAFGWSNRFAAIALFFSKMAVVTFGGAYAVLAYVAQEAVGAYHWLKPGEMLDGLGMAETTPGPLIIVNQFVGFMGAYRAPGALGPIWAGVLGGLLTTWVTFTPCFIWIFAGAPYVERLRGARALNAALTAITAAVVGVILNLAVWFALHTLFQQTWRLEMPGHPLDLPVLPSADLAALALTLGSIVAVFRFRVGTLPLLAGTAILGALLHLATARG